MKRHERPFLPAVVSTLCFWVFFTWVPTEGRSSLLGCETVSPESASASNSLMLCGNVYTWTDENGVVHFSDDLTRVPASKHQDMESITFPDRQSGPPTSSQPEQGPVAEDGAKAKTGPQEGPAATEGPAAEQSAYEKCMESVEAKKQELSKHLSEDQEMLDGLGRNLEKKKVEDGAVERTQRPQRDKPVRTRDKREYRRQRAELKKSVGETQQQMTNEVSKMEEECRRLR